MATRVEIHNISKENKNYKVFDELTFNSRNLYNCCMYLERQFIFRNFVSDINWLDVDKNSRKNKLSFKELYHLIRNNYEKDYSSLPSKIANQVLIQANEVFSNHFKAVKEYKLNPSKYTGKPKLPKYKKNDLRNIITYEKGSINHKTFNKNKDNEYEELTLSMTDIVLKTKLKLKDIKCVRVVKIVNSFKIEIVYEINDSKIKTDNGRYASIDPGLNNLFTIAFNTGDAPVIINGRPIKSINHYYNDKLAEYRSSLDLENNKRSDGIEIHTSNKIKKLTEKRNNKINDYLHKSSRMVVNLLVSMDVSILVIGKNAGWKQNINIGKKNNQNFVQVPIARLINILTYKLNQVGIKVILIEEAYTSKCSFFDNESIKKHKKNVGKRIKRGVFRTKTGKLINADVNAAYNIMKKAIPTAFKGGGIKGLAVNPGKIRFPKN